MTSFDRLPTWLQWLLVPGVWVFMLLSVWRASLVLIASGVVLLVYLKLNYPIDVTWGQVATLGTAVVWLPLMLGYLVSAWVALGTVPFALVMAWRCRRAGRPFGLRDPAEVLPAEVRTRLREGKPLSDADFQAIARQGDAGGEQAKLLGIITGISFTVTVIGLLAAEWLGRGTKDGNALAIMLSWSPLGPILFLYQPRPQLWCGACDQATTNINLTRLAKTGLCPKCGKPGPMTTRPPDPGKASVWDHELP